MGVKEPTTIESGVKDHRLRRVCSSIIGLVSMVRLQKYSSLLTYLMRQEAGTNGSTRMHR